MTWMRGAHTAAMALAPMHLPAPDGALPDVTGARGETRRQRRPLPLRRTRLERPVRPDALATPSAVALASLGAVHLPHR